VDTSQEKSANGMPQPHTGMIIEKKYELREKLGEGGMGSVFRARRLLIEDFVAIKFVRPEVLENPDVRQRFYQEAQVAARIKHPNVVTIHDFGETSDGLVYLVMEFLEGMSLGQLIKKNGPMPLDQTLGIGIQICEALASMLESNVIHRDLKPDNIMLVKDSQDVEMVKVVDFGVAKIVESDARLTRYKARVGSPVYCSPEQFLGKPVDHRTDLYGLGVILYECLTGNVPFEAQTEAELLAAIVHKTPQRLDEKIKGLSVLAADLVQWLLAKDPGDRPYNATQVGKCLESLLGGDAVPQALRRAMEEAKPNYAPAMPTPDAPSPKRPANDSATAKKSSGQQSARSAESTGAKSTNNSTRRSIQTSRKQRSSWLGYVTLTLFGMAIMFGVAVERGLDIGGYRSSILGVVDDLVVFSKELVSDGHAEPVLQPDSRRAARSSGSITPSIKKNAQPESNVRIVPSSLSAGVQIPPIKSDSAKSLRKDETFSQAAKIEMIASREGTASRPVELDEPTGSKISRDDRKGNTAVSKRSKKEISSSARFAIPQGMIWVSETKFMLGDAGGEGSANERPAHMVRVENFLISKHEVTNEEYFAFAKETGKHLPEWIEPGGKYHYQTGADDFYKKLGRSLYALDHPVVGVSWQDAVAYCEWLSKKTSLRYRLPTEAEWELAAQGGKEKIKYSWGNGSPQAAMGGNVADEALKSVLPDWPTIWRSYNDQHVYTSPVAKFSPNGLGLYDMTGNVWEWCGDWFDEKYYEKKVMESPNGPPKGTEKVIRGGSWSDTPAKLRISYRRGMPPSFRSNNLGFRVVAIPPANAKP
jgi:formylglycine-generating enzyme required for sulfatase activity